MVGLLELPSGRQARGGFFRVGMSPQSGNRDFACRGVMKGASPLPYLWSRPWRKSIYFLGISRYNRNPEPKNSIKVQYAKTQLQKGTT